MAKALSYSTLITVVLQVLGFARSIILAKLLLPTDFGLYGLVMTVVGVTGLYPTRRQTGRDHHPCRR